MKGQEEAPCGESGQKQYIPWWLYPNVLSLDAPLVAVLWMYVFARAWHIPYIEPLLPLVLAMAVWVIYTLDRLIDSKMHGDLKQSLRHQFHRAHSGILFSLVSLAVIAIVAISLFHLQWSIVTNSMLAVVGVALYFILAVFYQPQQSSFNLKNILAGCIFAIGCIAGLLGIATRDLSITSPEILCFAWICVINMSAIDVWEKPQFISDKNQPMDQKNWVITRPLILLTLFAMFHRLNGSNDGTRPLFDVIILCSIMMYVLHRMRRRLSVNAMRMGADGVLVLGALIYAVIRA